MSFHMLAKKYEMTVPLPDDCSTAIESWRDSFEVSELSSFLKENSKYGVRLCNRKGEPVLRFIPPLDLLDPDRIDFANTVIEMLGFALKDLRYLMSMNLIQLPEVTHG